MRIVVDTNLWISFLISGRFHGLDSLLFTNKITLLFSNELIAELKFTMAKPRLRKYFAENALEEMLHVFDPFIEFIQIDSAVKLCRDPKDDFLLALAKDGKANYLLTGDLDLLEIGKFNSTFIMKLTKFIEEHSPPNEDN